MFYQPGQFSADAILARAARRRMLGDGYGDELQPIQHTFDPSDPGNIKRFSQTTTDLPSLLRLGGKGQLADLLQPSYPQAAPAAPVTPRSFDPNNFDFMGVTRQATPQVDPREVNPFADQIMAGAMAGAAPQRASFMGYEVGQPAENGPLPQAAAPGGGLVRRTFTSPAGTTSYDMTPGYGSYTGGGNYRGIGFGDKAGEQAAIDEFNRAQGQRETGVSGVPSIEAILGNQLKGMNFGGFDGGAQAAREAAIGLQKTLIPGASKLEEQRIENERQREMLTSNKVIEAANYARQRVFNEGGSEDEAQEAYDKALRANQAVLPGIVRDRIGVTNPLAAAGPRKTPAEEALQSEALHIVRNAEYNRGSGQSLLEKLAMVSPEQRANVIKAIVSAKRNPAASGTIADIGPAVAKALAYNQMQYANAAASGKYENPDAPLPFQLQGHAITLPNGTVVNMGWNDRPDTLGALTPFARRSVGYGGDTMMRQAAADLFKALYGAKQ